MKRLRSALMMLGAAAVVMAAGACGSTVSGPSDASANEGGQGGGAQANVRPSPSPTPSPSPSASPSPGAEDNAELRGTIQSISAPNFTVGGRLIRTTGSTRFLDRDNNATGFGALSVGQPVEVEGNAQSDGSVLAFKVKLEDDDRNDDNGGHGGDDNGGDDNGGHGGDDNGGDDNGNHGGDDSGNHG